MDPGSTSILVSKATRIGNCTGFREVPIKIGKKFRKSARSPAGQKPVQMPRLSYAGPGNRLITRVRPRSSTVMCSK